MSKLPPLADWDVTRASLHTITRIASAIKKAHTASQINGLHLAFLVTPTGLTSGKLNDDLRVDIEFFDAALILSQNENVIQRIEFAGHPVGDVLQAAEQSGFLPAEVASDLNITYTGTMFILEPRLARDYARALHMVHGSFAQFWDALRTGTRTPLVVWPEGFDLSFLWFSGDRPDEQTQPHLAFGFSPYSEGFPRPYLYAYSRPMPENYETRVPPEGMRWVTKPWQGLATEYDAFAEHDTASEDVYAWMRAAYAALKQ